MKNLKIAIKLLISLTLSFGAFFGVAIFLYDVLRFRNEWHLAWGSFAGLVMLFLCYKYILKGNSFTGTIATGISFLRDTKDAITSDIDQRDADFFAQAESEIEKEIINQGLWSQALVRAKGNEQLRKVEYMKLRVKEIRKVRAESATDTLPKSSHKDSKIKLEDIDKNAIWNPNATVNWSFPFTPAFGSYLQSKNWQVLGDEKKAKGAMIWFYISIVAIIVSLSSFVIYKGKAVYSVDFWPLLWLLYITIWYYISGRSQAKYVKEKFGKDYSRRPWTKPLLIGFGGWLAYNAAVITLIAI